jgi:hypothetical protein
LAAEGHVGCNSVKHHGTHTGHAIEPFQRTKRTLLGTIRYDSGSQPWPDPGQPSQFHRRSQIHVNAFPWPEWSYKPPSLSSQ